MKIKIRNDIILVVAILLSSLILLLVFKNGLKSGDRVVVSVDGKLVYSLPLNEYTEKTVLTELGENKILIQNGTARVIDANCRDKICVGHKEISKIGETIVCLPHKLVVEIEGEETD